MAIDCSGTSAVCPENDPRYFKPDRTICGAGKLLCMNGSCSLSICALHSLLPCQLKEPEDQLCMIACQQKNGLCVPYQNIQSNSTSSKPLYFPCKSHRSVNVCDKESFTRWITVQFEPRFLWSIPSMSSLTPRWKFQSDRCRAFVAAADQLFRDLSTLLVGIRSLPARPDHSDSRRSSAHS